MGDSRSRSRAARAQKSPLTAKKRPSQDRSRQLVADILEAALRVLERDGAARFTTVRVAEEAGVSVGSLYQYFPNKASLLFRLQADEWAETSAMLVETLGDETRTPTERLERMIVVFFRSEREEAPVRLALADALRLVHASSPETVLEAEPEAIAHDARQARILDDFLEKALPALSARERRTAAQVIAVTLSSAAERVTSKPIARAELDVFARGMADAMTGYLLHLARRGTAG